jgi:hypothetical protein
LYILGQAIRENERLEDQKMKWMEGMDQDSEMIRILKRSNCFGILLARPEGNTRDWRTKNY